MKEDEELRCKIQAWIKERKQAIRQEKEKKRRAEKCKQDSLQDSNGDVNMDA